MARIVSGGVYINQRREVILKALADRPRSIKELDGLLARKKLGKRGLMVQELGALLARGEVVIDFDAGYIHGDPVIVRLPTDARPWSGRKERV
jgi:hypothetical protein